MRPLSRDPKAAKRERKHLVCLDPLRDNICTTEDSTEGHKMMREGKKKSQSPVVLLYHATPSSRLERNRDIVLLAQTC